MPFPGTKGVMLYKGTVLGFSFTYPNSFGQLKDTSVTDGSHRLEFWNGESGSVSETFSLEVSPYTDTLISTPGAPVAGLPATRSTIVDPSGARFIEVQFTHEGYLYTLSAPVALENILDMATSSWKFQ